MGIGGTYGMHASLKTAVALNLRRLPQCVPCHFVKTFVAKLVFMIYPQVPRCWASQRYPGICIRTRLCQVGQLGRYSDLDSASYDVQLLVPVPRHYRLFSRCCLALQLLFTMPLPEMQSTLVKPPTRQLGSNIQDQHMKTQTLPSPRVLSRAVRNTEVCQ